MSMMSIGGKKTSIIFFIVFVLLLIFGTVSYIIISKSKPESENLTEASTETEKNLTGAAITENTGRFIQEKLQIKEAPSYTHDETLSWFSSMESDSDSEPEHTVFEYPSKNHVSNTEINYPSASDIDSDSNHKSDKENEINREAYQDPENTGSIVESDTKTSLSNDSTGAIEGQNHEQQENGITNGQQNQNELLEGVSSIEQPAQESTVPETLETEENIPEALSDSISTVDGVIKNEETDPSKKNFVADPVILSANNGFVSYRRGMVSNVPYDKLDVEPPNYIHVTTTQYGNDQFSNRFDRAVILTFSHLNSIKDPKDHKRTPLEEMLQLKTKFEDITEDNVKYQIYIKVEPTGHFGYKSITELQYYDFVKSKLANIFSDRGIGAEIAKIILPNFGGNAEILVTMKNNQLTKEDSSEELEVASEHSGCVYDVALTPDSEIEAHTDSDGGSKVVTEQLHPPEIENAEEFNTDNDLSDLTSSLMGDLAVESEDIDNDHLGDPSDVSKVVVIKESNNKSTEEKKKNELLEGNESSEEILLQKSTVAAVENETSPTDENTLNLKENNGSISNTAHSKRSSEDEGVSVIKLQSESESENEKNSSDELDEQSNERNENDNIYDTNISTNTAVEEEINSTETAKEEKEHSTSTETESEEKSEISDVNTVKINTVVPTETETDSKTDEVHEESLSEKVEHNDGENTPLTLNAKEVTIDTTNKIFHDHISYGRGVYSNETEGSNYINVKTIYYDGTDESDKFDRALFLTFTHSDKYLESQTEEQQFQKLKSETIKCFVNTIESKDDDCDYSVYSKVTPTGIWSNYKSIDEKQYFEILKKYLPELMLSHKVGETIGREILEKFGGDVGICVERKKRSKD